MAHKKYRSIKSEQLIKPFKRLYTINKTNITMGYLYEYNVNYHENKFYLNFK